MKNYLIALTFIFFAAALNAQPTEKKFNVSSGGKLEMNVSYGDIAIETTSSNEVIVSSDDEFEESDQISQSGNTIHILSDFPKDFRIRIPKTFSLNISTSGGDIRINGDLTGELNMVTAAGSISFNDILGNVTVNTGGGDISGGDITGRGSLNTAGGSVKLNNTEGDLKINSAGGDIRVERVTKSAEVNTGGGNITLGTIDGKASVRSGGGDVQVASVSSGLSAVTGGGNMVIKDSRGEVNVTTGGGDIKVTSKSGNVKIKSGAGNVTADLVPGISGENLIITGNGDVRLLIPENSKTTIRVITKEKHREDVQILSDFSLTTEDRKENERITVYQINGGGSTIEIRNGFGNVEIKKKK